MKTTLLLLLNVAILHALFAQQEPATGILTRSDYLTKSRTNRTVGFIFLAGGAALTAGGIIGSENSDDLDFSGVAAAAAGIGTMLASIPFFIIASNQSAKAARLSGGIKMERSRIALNRTYVFQAYPALTLRCSLP